MQQVTAQQNDTLDLLVWRYLGSTAGYVEETLELNPGIAQYGPVLPHGTQVLLPDAKPSTAATQDIVQLWD